MYYTYNGTRYNMSAVEIYDGLQKALGNAPSPMERVSNRTTVSLVQITSAFEDTLRSVMEDYRIIPPYHNLKNAQFLSKKAPRI